MPTCSTATAATTCSRAASAATPTTAAADFDTADYATRIAGLTIDLDGAADDGETAEADNVRPDVERLLGGDGDDTLTGNNATNELDGGDGNDVLDLGRGTLDVAIGRDGTDTVTYSTRTAPVIADLDGLPDDGEAGENDRISADVENLTGGSANDRLTGSPDANVLNGGTGNDVLDGGARRRPLPRRIRHRHRRLHARARRR